MAVNEADKRWYVLHTYSGYENKVKQNIDLRTESMGMEENIFRVLVPTEEVDDPKNEDKKKSKKIFPGYVLVEMIMSDQAWYVVRNTPGVTGFVGSQGAGSKPSPLLDDEVDALLNPGQINTRRRTIDLEVGERVSVNEGAFQGMEGIVEATDEEKGKVRVTIEMFGRETSAELDYDQISKIYNQ